MSKFMGELDALKLNLKNMEINQEDMLRMIKEKNVITAH